ncbi:Uncharacterized membrane protein YgdD, TMEM256/DUF423 family [Fictibacillus solisalsi]|uniref:Uncharacterized membrane protein YgdD, TMEM256/DUF423 family n=1 Tax=Fictibacillus solisalsi TaxID=459525 RepID=A0A1H0BA98_9BACL|nr:DUF423 domain-containing protein [Fictibacillus solisalsi]SDN42273.1 Uncharacterized membrane protein YgdD, TMEM256/DUF423 family [Fictibacillus solisalsi]
MKLFLILGAANAAVAVMLGAFGAHGLEGKLSERMLEVYKTGVQYHMYHAIGLLAVGLLTGKITGSGQLHWAGWLMFIGIILFSGSLYALSTTGISKLGIITPFGGVAFIAGWVLLIVAAAKGL